MDPLIKRIDAIRDEQELISLLVERGMSRLNATCFIKRAAELAEAEVLAKLADLRQGLRVAA